MKGYFVGIDEAGRGPLAGPVAVGVVVANKRDITLPPFREIRDSKKLSGQKRRAVFETIKNAQQKKELAYAVAFSGPAMIDKEGINTAIYKAIKRCLNRLGLNPKHAHVLLDGGLRAPKFYLTQETIIRGDESEPLIALASIVAKVRRDEKMEREAQKHPKYSFEEHKGYGTELHRKMIRKHKPCPIHRKTFLGNIV